jgi:hypothetical protein
MVLWRVCIGLVGQAALRAVAGPLRDRVATVYKAGSGGFGTPSTVLRTDLA